MPSAKNSILYEIDANIPPAKGPTENPRFMAILFNEKLRAVFSGFE